MLSIKHLQCAGKHNREEKRCGDIYACGSRDRRCQHKGIHGSDYRILYFYDISCQIKRTDSDIACFTGKSNSIAGTARSGVKYAIHVTNGKPAEDDYAAIKIYLSPSI